MNILKCNRVVFKDFTAKSCKNAAVIFYQRAFHANKPLCFGRCEEHTLFDQATLSSGGFIIISKEEAMVAEILEL
jgi:hypothetical protein